MESWDQHIPQEIAEATPQLVENQVDFAHPHLLRFHRLRRGTETAMRCRKEFCSSAQLFSSQFPS